MVTTELCYIKWGKENFTPVQKDSEVSKTHFNQLKTLNKVYSSMCLQKKWTLLITGLPNNHSGLITEQVLIIPTTAAEKYPN